MRGTFARIVYSLPTFCLQSCRGSCPALSGSARIAPHPAARQEDPAARFGTAQRTAAVQQRRHDGRTLKGAVAGAAAVTGNIAAAKAAAAATGKGGLGGTLTQLGRNYMMSRSPVRSYRDAISGFRHTKDYTGTQMLKDLRAGKNSYSTKRVDDDQESGK